LAATVAMNKHKLEDTTANLHCALLWNT